MRVERIECPLYASNVYLLEDEGSDKVWLVDIGTADLPIPETKSVACVFITHTHIDHIQGVNALLEKYPKCVVYTSEEGKRGLYDDKINLSLYHEAPLCFRGGEIHIVKEGDGVELFDGVKLEVFETPGHHPSCLCFKVGRLLFTGDSFIPGVKVVSKLKGGDKVLAEKSVERIVRMVEDDGLVVCAGHGV